MNQRTAKLLKKLAGAEGKKPRDVRRWWRSLNWIARTAERRRIRAKVEGE